LPIAHSAWQAGAGQSSADYSESLADWPCDRSRGERHAGDPPSPHTGGATGRASASEPCALWRISRVCAAVRPCWSAWRMRHWRPTSS